MILTVVLILAGWVAVSVPVALVTGRMLARCSRTRAAADADAENYLASLRGEEAV